MSEHQLDTRRLLCPMPVIKTQDFIKQLNDGDQLTVTGTDPGILNDIPAWCRVHGHEVLNVTSIERDMIVTIRVCRD